MAAPTSTNEVTARKLSASISAFWAKIKSTFQTLGNLVTAWGSTPSDTKYPSEKLVKDSLDGKADDSNVVHKTGTETVSGAKTFSNTSSVFSGKCANDINGVTLSSAYGVFRTELGNPTLEERGIIEETFANQLECLPKDKIVYETSPKGTETWTTLTVSDYTHNLLWGGNVIGALSISKTVDFRITINAPSYCYLNFLYFYASGNGATFHIKLEKKLNSSGAWSVVSDTAETSIGWPGHNTIRHGNLAFNPTTSAQYGSVRLTLYMVSTGNVESCPTYDIYKFRYYGGYPYKVDPWIVKNGSSRVTNFPKGITSGVAIPVGSGGTGKASVTAGNYLVGNGTNALTEKTPNVAANDLINALTTGESTPTDNDYYVAQYAGGGTTTKTYHRRPVKALWEYIKGKISSVLGLTETSYGGNAATATKATQDSDGNAINATYFKSSGNTTLVAGAATKIGTQNGADVKLTLPTIPSGSQLVYDCGTGSTSTTDFSNALAAYGAGMWVIIRKDGVIYHCVGTYNSSLRFKTFANESDLLKVRTLNWTSGSAPTTGTQLEASLTGHTHSQYLTSSDITGKMETNGSNATSAAGGNIIRAMGDWNTPNENNEALPAANITSGGTDQGRYTFAKIWNWITSHSQVLLSSNSTDGYIGVGQSGKAIAYLEAYDSKGGVWVNNGGTSTWITYRDSDGTVHFGADSSNSYSGVAGDGSVKNFFNGAEICGNSYRNSGTSHYRFYFGKMTPGTDNGAKHFCGLLEVNTIATTSGAVRGTGFVAIIKIDSRNYDEFHVNMSIISNNGWNLTGLRPTLIVTEDGDLRKFSIGFTNASGTLQAFQYTRFNLTQIGYSLGFTYDRWFNATSSKGSGEYFWPATLGDAENAVSANELRIPYGSGSAYLQIGVSGSYLALGTNMADGVMVSYAGEASTAAVAGRLGTASVGSSDNPIYLNNGVPTACNWWVS